MNQPFAISQRGVKLFQRERRASAVTIRIRAERQINALRCITKIEVGRFSQTAGAQRPKFALMTAAAGHVEFVHDQASFHISNLHVKREK